MVTGGRTTRFHGPAIRAWREQRGFTGKAFAERLGIGAPHLTNIEADRRAPSRELALDIAKALGVTDLRVLLRDYPDVPLPVDRPDDWPVEWQQ